MIISALKMKTWFEKFLVLNKLSNKRINPKTLLYKEV